MVTTILFLAAATGLGLRLARWVADLPDKPAAPIGPAAAPPRRAARAAL